MRRAPLTFSKHDAPVAHPAAVSWGPAGLPQSPPQSAGPIMFDPVIDCSEEDLALLIRQARMEDRIARILPWVDRVSLALGGVALFLAAQPIWAAVKAVLS